mgnify:CR=1 FL=1
MTDIDWINREEYPFESHFFNTKVGKMHYLDEGKGDPVVFVPGNPSWSFQFRNCIKILSHKYRCIAPDHIGFGLSDKPRDWSYLPKDHSGNFEDFMETLDLNNIIMEVGDWGGPIGLSYAINHPERMKGLVITNTWLWSVKKDWYYQAFSKFVGGPIGRILIDKRNFFARDIVRMAFGDKKKLTEEVHKHYLKPLESKNDRRGSWVFPREVVGSHEWLDSLWEKRNLLKKNRVVLAWGMKDIAFREKELKMWMELFTEARVVRYGDAGHFVAEEKPDEISELITEISR